MYRKPIQVDEDTNTIIKCEAARLTIVKGKDVSMGDVVVGIAKKINKKYGYVKAKK